MSRPDEERVSQILSAMAQRGRAAAWRLNPREARRAFQPARRPLAVPIGVAAALAILAAALLIPPGAPRNSAGSGKHSSVVGGAAPHEPWRPLVRTGVLQGDYPSASDTAEALGPTEFDFTSMPYGSAPPGYGVSCGAPDHCWIVDGLNAAQETTDGTTWTSRVVPSPRAGTLDSLNAVWCTSAVHCFVAGREILQSRSRGVMFSTDDAGAAWSPEQVPAGIVDLVAVTCAGSAHCWALGHTAGHSGIDTAIIATRDGGATWTPEVVPAGAESGVLSSISCPSTTACWASGTAEWACPPEADCPKDSWAAAVVLRTADAGRHWSMSAHLPTPGFEAYADTLSAISCPKVDRCWTVGDRYFATFGPWPGIGPMIFRTTDGEHWVAQAPPLGVQVLNTVSCPSLDRCVAGGWGNPATREVTLLAAVWTVDGTHWTGATQWSNEQIDALSCTSLDRCAGVGNPGPEWASVNPDALPQGIWDSRPVQGVAAFRSRGPGTWSVQSLESTQSLIAPACSSASRCIAVGAWEHATNGQPGPTCVGCPAGPAAPPADAVVSALVESTSDGGTTWEHVQVPGDATSLDALSCADQATCVAVGDMRPGRTVQDALAMRSGLRTIWTNPPIPPGTAFDGAAVFSHDGGRTWHDGDLPPGPSTLTGVSCPSTRACFATGDYEPLIVYGNAAIEGTILASTDGGATWARQTLPVNVSSVTGVTCTTSTACLATGSLALPTYGATVPIVLGTVDGGAHWIQHTVPAGVGDMSAITCTSARHCVAVGDTTVAQESGDAAHLPDGNGVVILESDDGGTTWRLDRIPTVLTAKEPDGGSNGMSVVPYQLTSVACADARHCVATGEGGTAGSSTFGGWGVSYTTSDGGAHWSGSVLPEYVTGDLQAVTCPAANACLAVDGPDVLTTAPGPAPVRPASLAHTVLSRLWLWVVLALAAGLVAAALAAMAIGRARRRASRAAVS